MPELSLILPFHNESAGVRGLFHELHPVLGQLNLDYEIICIDDGSTDNTYEALLHARQFDQRLKIIRLARNFGKEVALTCGLNASKGNAAITMDSDLQHPPETIIDLVKKWREGYQMVYATRHDRRTDSKTRRFLSRAFYVVFRKIADIQMPDGAGDFCLLDRKVIDAINSMPERNRFMKGLTAWVGFKQGTTPYIAAPRSSGATHWNFFRLIRFAFDGLSAFSTLPLRIWMWCGVLVSFGAMAYGIYLILSTLFFGVDVPGYASIMVGILFLGGLQLLSLGVIGEYMARVFTEVKARPLYFVAERVGFE